MNNTYERFISETAAMYAAWMKLKAGKTILVEISPGGWHIFVVEPKKEEKPVTWKCEYCGEDVPRNMNHVCREFLEQLGLPFVNTEKAEKKD